MKRFAWFAMVAIVGWMLAGGSTGFSAPPKKAPPKHGGGKPAHPGAKPKPHDAHKGASNQDKGKEKEKEEEKEKGKSKEGAHEEHKSNKLAKDDLHDHHEDIHPHLHGEHDTIENRTVNKTVGGSVNGGTPAVVGAGAVGPSGGGMAVGAGPSLPGAPQLFFSFNESERGRYDAAARAAKLDRDEWIRRTLNGASR